MLCLDYQEIEAYVEGACNKIYQSRNNSFIKYLICTIFTNFVVGYRDFTIYK